MPGGIKATPKKLRSAPKKRRTLRRTLLRLLVLWVAVVALGSATFVGTQCYNWTAPAARRGTPLPPEGLPGYHRAEVFTYLTLPEWYIVYTTDEYAAHLAQRPPSAFPYFGSVRQYWGYYGAACAATKGTYTFETGYHMMLGIIGASFTMENSIKAAYENTIGRISEMLSSTDTAEDVFARRTAAEYGTFMHSVPWYEFPFASRLATFWRETPFRGPHKIRKIERRLALTVEYSVKAVYGWIIGKASGTAYAAEDLRIYARIDHASAGTFKDTRVKQVRALGAGEYLVTLPRYQEFTRTALALTAQGVRFVDIAGNEQILMTVLARRGMPQEVPQATLVTTKPILADPTMQRLAYGIPVASLREIAAYLARERAVIEHLYDY